MNRLLAILLMIVLTLSAGSTAALAQDEPDNTEACAALAVQQEALDAYEAQVDAAFVGYYAQVDALDAQLPREFDAQLNAYRAYIASSELMIDGQIAVAQASIDAGLAANDC